MTAPETALELRIAGWSLVDISEELGHSDIGTTQWQLTAALERTRYALLGEDAALHLLRLDALAAVIDRGLVDQYRAPGDRLHARAQRIETERQHAAALEAMTRRLGRQLSTELSDTEDTDQ